MKRAATIGLAMTLITLNAGLFSTPAMADGLLGDLVKDTLGTAAGIVGGVVGGAAGIAGGAVRGAADVAGGVVSGTVDATGAVLDTSGHVVGRVLGGPSVSTTAIVPGWTTVTPETATTLIPGTTISSERIYTFGPGATVYSATIDTRISDLRNAINVAESQGKLTAVQATELRARLDRIATAYAGTRAANDFTFPGAIAVARDLDTFNTSLATTLSLTPFTPLVVAQNGTDRLLISSALIPGTTVGTVGSTNIVGSTVGGVGGIVGGVLNGVGHVVGGALNAVGGVTGGLVGGTLATAGGVVTSAVTSTGDVVDATGHVIGSVIPGTYDAPVTTTTSGSRVIFGTTTNVLSTNIDLRMADMRRLIAEDQISGRLTPVQAAELTASLDRIATQLGTYRAAGSTLTFDNAIGLARDLDAANVRFGTFIGSNPFNPMVVMEAGSPRMMIITKNGVISALPGSGVVNGGTVVTTTGGTIATGVPTTIIGNGGISTSSVALIPILDQRRLEFDRLLANAVANHSISAADSARLQNELTDIANRIVAANTAGPTYSIDQVITLARVEDDFNNQLATAINASPLTPLTIIGANNLPVLSTTVFNNVIGLPAVQPNMWFSTLSDRRTALDAMIANGITAGTISAAQAAELRAESLRIGGLIDAARATGTISYSTALPLAMNLDVLGNRIHTYVTNVGYTPLISSGRIGFVGGVSAPIDDLSLRRAELGAAIDREKALGRLTPNEAQRLQFELSSIGNREKGFLSDGYLSYRELVILTNDLNRFQVKLNNMIANRRSTVSVR